MLPPVHPTQRVEVLDSLRGLASLAVCVFHFTNGQPLLQLPEVVKSVGEWGGYGVHVFFVISGFIIPYSLHRGGYQPGDYPKFILKRLLRLDPPYLANIAMILLLGWMLPRQAGEPEPTAAGVLLHLGYLPVFYGEHWLNPVYWTLAIEFHYYLLVGLIHPALAHRSSLVRGAVFVVLGTAQTATHLATKNDYYFLTRWLMMFMMGALVFQLKAGLTTKRAFWATLPLLAAGCWHSLGAAATGVGVVTALMIAFARYSNQALLFLGGISYSLYLAHGPLGLPLLGYAAKLGLGPTANMAVVLVVLAVTIAASHLLWKAVERPAQKWSSAIRFRKQREELRAESGEHAASI